MTLRVVEALTTARVAVVRQLWIEYRDSLRDLAERSGGCA